MISDSDSQSAVELLVDEFLDRRRRGERPSIDEYCDRHPELADEIRDVFEAMLLVEDLKPETHDGSVDESEMRPGGPRLERVGDYRILREIGRGGMGVVYEAEQESLGRRVALKVLPRQAAGDERAIERFQREARAAARMHHTNIVPVFEVGGDEDYVFYAMQLITGQGLDLVIDDLRRIRFTPDRSELARMESQSIAASLIRGEFEEERLGSDSAADHSASACSVSSDDASTVAYTGGDSTSAVLPGQSENSVAENNRRAYFQSVAQIGLQTAQALSYAHVRGVIHRDVKPANLLLDAAGVVWVTDFGLAKTNESSMTHTGDILGTIRYMSPERFSGQCDVRADIYSLGLTLYELLVLEPAFASADRLRLIETVRSTNPPPPRSVDQAVPRDLETIVLKSVEKDPRLRYQSADDLADDLQRFIHDEPIHARRVSTSERLIRWSRRNPLLACVMGVAAALLIAVAGMSLQFARQQKRQADKQRSLNDQLSASQRKTEQERQKALEAKKRAEAMSAINRQQAYVATIQAVSRLVDGERVSAATAEDMLARWLSKAGEPDERDFAWRYLWRQLVGSAEQLALPAARLTFAENGDLITFGHNQIRRWRRGGGKLDLVATTRVFDQNRSYSLVEFSRHGKQLAFTSRQAVYVFDVQTQTFTGPIAMFPNMRLDVSPDRRLAGFLNGSDQSLTLWDFDQAQVVRTIENVPRRANDYAVQPDGKTVVLRDGSSILVIPPDGEAKTYKIEDAFAQRSLQTSPDGRYAAVGDASGKLNIIDLTTGKWFPLLATASGSRILRFSFDSMRIAVGGYNGALVVYDVKEAKEVFRRQAHSSPIFDVMFSDDPDILATTSSDFTRVWNVNEPSAFDRLAVPAEGVVPWSLDENDRGGLFISGLRVSTEGVDQSSAPIGDLVVGVGEGDQGPMVNVAKLKQKEIRELLSGEAGTVVRLKLRAENQPEDSARIVQTKRYPKTHQNVVRVVEFSNDGKWIANAGRLGCNLWRVGESEPAVLLPDGYAAAFSPDSQYAAFGDTASEAVNIISLAKPNQKQPEWFIGSLVSDLVFTWDNRYLVASVGLRDAEIRGWGSLKVFDLDQFKEVKHIPAHGMSVHALAMSPDGKIMASSGSDRTIQLWDCTDWSPIRSFTLQGAVTLLRFTPDGQSLVASLGQDVIVWDLKKGQLSRRLEGHSGWVRGLSIARDGTLASASWDGTVRLWNRNSHQLMATFRAHDPAAYSVDFSPNGDVLASGGADGTIKFWRANPRDGLNESAAALRLRYKQVLKLVSLNRIGEADAELESIARLQAQHLGKDHPHTLDSIFQRGRLRFLKGDYQQAGRHWLTLFEAGVSRITPVASVPRLIDQWLEQLFDDERIRIDQAGDRDQLHRLRDAMDQLRENLDEHPFADRLAQIRPLDRGDEAFRKKLQGHWKLISLKLGLRPERDFSRSDRNTIEITEDEIISHYVASDESRPYFIDAQSSPMKMDLFDMDSSRQQLEVDRYIFELDGDTLRRATFREDRPENFEPGEQVVIATFRRISAKDVAESRRTRQVDMQAGPPRIFERPDIQNELRLDVRQRREISKILDGLRDELRRTASEMRRANNGGGFQQFIEKQLELFTARRTMIVDEVLTDDQRAVWSKMIGPPATQAEIEQMKSKIPQRSPSQR